MYELNCIMNWLQDIRYERVLRDFQLSTGRKHESFAWTQETVPLCVVAVKR